jgi:hypothetical protein
MGTPRLPAAVLALAATFAMAFATGCGSSDQSLSVKEGEPVTLGDLHYNVQITRYLNPDDVEDRSYLQGAPPLPNADYYLGVFMQVQNDGGTAQGLPQDFKVVDTDGNEFHATPLTNDFALQLGSQVEAHGQVPAVDSAADTGPIQGSMVLFLVSQAAIENRPLILQIPSASGASGEVELDL